MSRIVSGSRRTIQEYRQPCDMRSTGASQGTSHERLRPIPHPLPPQSSWGRERFLDSGMEG